MVKAVGIFRGGDTERVSYISSHPPFPSLFPPPVGSGGSSSSTCDTSSGGSSGHVILTSLH